MQYPNTSVLMNDTEVVTIRKFDEDHHPDSTAVAVEIHDEDGEFSVFLSFGSPQAVEQFAQKLIDAAQAYHIDG